VVGVSPTHFGTELDDALDAMGTAIAATAAAPTTQRSRFTSKRMVFSFRVISITVGPAHSPRNRAGTGPGSGLTPDLAIASA
jgi:hypothetical protein